MDFSVYQEKIAERRPAAEAVVFSEAPTDTDSALRWLDAALIWWGHRWEGDDASGDPFDLITSFHWDTHATDITPELPRARQRVYDRNSAAAQVLIDQQIGDAYKVINNVQPCQDCYRLILWTDDGGWNHLDRSAPACFLHR